MWSMVWSPGKPHIRTESRRKSIRCILRYWPSHFMPHSAWFGNPRNVHLIGIPQFCCWFSKRDRAMYGNYRDVSVRRCHEGFRRVYPESLRFFETCQSDFHTGIRCIGQILILRRILGHRRTPTSPRHIDFRVAFDSDLEGLESAFHRNLSIW